MYTVVLELAVAMICSLYCFASGTVLHFRRSVFFRGLIFVLRGGGWGVGWIIFVFGGGGG